MRSQGLLLGGLAGISELYYLALHRYFREDRHSKLEVLQDKTQSPHLVPSTSRTLRIRYLQPPTPQYPRVNTFGGREPLAVQHATLQLDNND